MKETKAIKYGNIDIDITITAKDEYLDEFDKEIEEEVKKLEKEIELYESKSFKLLTFCISFSIGYIFCWSSTNLNFLDKTFVALILLLITYPITLFVLWIILSILIFFKSIIFKSTN